MQVTDSINYKNTNCSKTYKTCILCLLLNVFGLNCATKKSKISCVRSVLTSGLFALLALFNLYCKVLYVYSFVDASIQITEAIQTIYDYCQYTIDLIFVQKYGGAIYCDYYKQYSTIDDLIGRKTHSETVKRRIAKLIGLFLIIWLTTSICDFLAWFQLFGWKIPIMYSLTYVYLLIKMLTTLDIISEVLNVQCRMRMISEIIQNVKDYADCLPGMMGYTVCNKYWTGLNSGEAVSERHKSGLPDYNKVKWLSKCYLLLAEQCAYINQMFGIRILLNSLSLLIDMVKLTNLAIRMIMGAQLLNLNPDVYFSSAPIVVTVARLLICVLILASLVFHCESVYRQNDRIINIIDHILINKNTGPELRSSMSELRGLVQERPLNFHLANCFRVDYSLLVSTASVVSTYTIILLQTVN